ncbi:putative bifunctional diguanylate cyclase/phosphodiesterase [Marinobacter fonticola]|uniref:putative bifunctional diguanylate cyclase/phosphodiesterase n=1 Tax=Marinobacter fonticola TaxID=2603215 RepID=UPI0011E84E8F|nr:EAL domain-containing protein [Marinobacter fonticola]
MHNESSNPSRGLSRALLHPVLPAILILAFVVLTVGFWRGVESQARHQIQLTLQAETSALARELQGDFQSHVRALRRMAERRAALPSLPQAVWKIDADNHLRDFNHYQAIEWVDSDYRIRWITPLAGNENVEGFNVAFNAERLASLQRATRTGQVDFSGIIELRQGGTGIVVYAPIVHEGTSLGYIAGVFRMEGLIEALITPRILDNFQVEIIESGTNRFVVVPDAPVTASIEQTTALDVPGLDWHLRLTPTQPWVESHRGEWPHVAPLGLMGLGVLISALVWLAQLIMRRNQALTQAQDALQEEVYQRESVQQDLARIESTDSLTGLANRRFFMEDLTHTLAIADRHFRQVALIMLDLDRFQILNDTLGHHFGDELLIKVADRLNRFSTERVLVAYSSGDEFMISQQHIEDIDEVIYLLGQIKQCFAEPFIVQEQEHHVSATLGVAVYPQSGLDADILLRNADVALYRAKESGRNHYQFYTEGMQDREVRRLELDKDLNKALSEDQLVLHFQPQLDLATQQIGSVEALVRWQHPTRGLLPPADFIPLAEESGRISDIGRWVALAACRQLAAWQGGPLGHLRVAINLSGRELEDPDLVENIENALRNNNVSASQLEVELTEEIFIENLERNLDQLKRLNQLGVHLAIDDFGTGYSSLAYLRDFPVDLLKIDRSFITRVTERHDDAIITRAVINLAHNLGIQVAAEGIETEAQLSFLRTHRCDLAQGYLIGRPLPVRELESLVAKGVDIGDLSHQSP